jgi:branched-chain amino acid aminotransferase
MSTSFSGSPASGSSAAASRKAPRATRKVWIDGSFYDRDQAKISVYDHGFLYGDGCFEGIRAYGGRIFKARSHIDRLFSSAERLRLRPPCTKDELNRVMHEALEVNELADGYIRLVLSRGVGTLGLSPFKCPEPTIVVIVDSIELYPPALYEKGLDVIVSQRPRVPIKCLDPSIKSLNYLNNILAKVEAIDRGCLEAIMLNLDGYVAECTGDNVFVVRNGVIETPAPDAGFLHGITRKFVIDELAPACGLRAIERMMRVEDVYGASEVFLTGTAAEIIGVVKVDDRKIGSGAVGPVTRKLTDAFRARIGKGAPED